MQNKIRKSDEIDRIEAYYRNGIELLPKELEKCKRYELAFSLLLEHRHRKSAVTKYVALCKINPDYFSISIGQAYKDMTIAERLFAPLMQYKKEFIRLTVVESAVKDIKAIESRLKKTKDDKTWHNLMDLKNRVEKRLIDSTGLNLNDPDLPDFTNIKPPEYNVVLPDEVLNMLKQFKGKGSINVSDLFDSAEEVTIEDE